jgi:hypothetical protein
MTVYVYRDGQLVEASTVEPSKFAKSANFPSPRVSRFDAFASPVTGQQITSWRQRERDMNAADAVDRRDMPENRRRTKHGRPDKPA